MAYQAIYRKWRPLSFEDVVGQAHIVDTLKTEIKSGRLAHAYLFCGTRGTGKTTTAKILSRAMNCEHLLPNGNPCNACDSCKGILNGSVMDVVEIDAASNNGVDNIRELREEIIYAPANVKYKVYIIDEVHMLSTGAFNALLKTLEEPPAHAVFILATTEPHKIPATIQSRCQRFDFRRISAKHIAGRIGEIVRADGFDITPDAVQLVAEIGDGSMRDALSVLDLCTGFEGQITRSYIEEVAGIPGRQQIFSITKALTHGDLAQAIRTLSEMAELGRDMNNVLESLISYFRELLLCKMLKSPEEVLEKAPEELTQDVEMLQDVPGEALLHCIKLLSDYAVICKQSNNPQVMLESAFVKLCYPEYDTSSEAFGARLAKLESAVLTGNTTGIQASVQKAEPAIQPVPQPKPVQPRQPEPAMDYPPPVFDEPPLPEEPPAPPVMQEPTPSQPNTDYGAKLNAVCAQNPAIGSLLAGTRTELHHETVYIVFQDGILRDTMAKNPMFADTVSKALQPHTVKFVTQEEFENNGNPKGDPLDDIIAMADSIEQLTIYES